MQEKLLKKIVANITGQGSEKLVDLLFKKQNVNEFLIAKKLDLTINQTRNVLYKLADEGLVTFIRKKDKKKGGWYTYFWTLKIKRSLDKLSEELNKKIKELERQLLIRETERHFYCKNCDLEYNEEDAMLLEYTCSECGEILEIRETKEINSHIKTEIKKLNEEFNIVKEEIIKLEFKEVKTRERKLKIELKKKEEERKKKRKEREKEKHLAARVESRTRKRTDKKVKKTQTKKKSSRTLRKQDVKKKTKTKSARLLRSLRKPNKKKISKKKK